MLHELANIMSSRTRSRINIRSMPTLYHGNSRQKTVVARTHYSYVLLCTPQPGMCRKVRWSSDAAFHPVGPASDQVLDRGHEHQHLVHGARKYVK